MIFVGGLLALFHCRFEASETFPYSFAKLRKLLRAKREQAIPKTNNRCVG